MCRSVTGRVVPAAVLPDAALPWFVSCTPPFVAQRRRVFLSRRRFGGAVRPVDETAGVIRRRGRRR